MAAEVPAVLPWLVMGDDARLLAQVSSVLAKRNSYLPLIEGPRLTRNDAKAEVLRRNNAAARLQPNEIIFAGLPASTCNLFMEHFGTKRIRRIERVTEVPRPVESGPRRRRPITWGAKNIGLGLLRALRTRSLIQFDNSAECPRDPAPTRSGHLVVCEDDNELAQVIAANYAFALDAGLCLIPAPPSREAEDILERFYAAYEKPGDTPTSLLRDLRDLLRSMMGPLPAVTGGSITFIARCIPWGFAFDELPSSHLFSYPDLGISILNGLVAEQPGTAGIRIASIIDPGSVDSREIAVAIDRLTSSGVFSTGLRSRLATVNRVSNLVELFPYDLLLISTHSGDVSGWRWTYDYKDSEGLQRILVIEVAIGVQRVPGQEELKVTEFYRFVSLDGVDWTDPQKKEKLYVGRAITDWAAQAEAGNKMEPVSRHDVERVRGSMALKMADHNYIPLPISLAASSSSPIIINNACCSWHRLASNFIFGNARAYIGTLFDVIDPVAQTVVERLFTSYWNKPLAVALWRAQNDATDGSVKRPYVMVGCHFQRLRATSEHNLAHALKELRAVLLDSKKRLENPEELSDKARRTVSERVEYLEQQIAGILDYVQNGRNS